MAELPPSLERTYDVWEVRRALEQLAPEDTEVVRLQHLDGLTQTQVAERLGLPLGTVKSRSFRAHRRLAGLLSHLRDEPAEPKLVERRTGFTEENPQ